MTNEQRLVLAHVVIDPAVWYANAVKALGQDGADAALVAKVARWQADYDAAKSNPAKYLDRAAREAAAPVVVRKPPSSLTPQEKLAATGLTVAELKSLLA